MKSNLIQGRDSVWEVVIGLEVHAQINSKSKLFSQSSTAFGAEPNTQVNFFDVAMPGILPVLNSYCVDQAIKTGFGINGKINKVSVFDRKNYFYADLPQGYQISQFYYPIVSDGHLDIDLEDGSVKRIKIARLHIEQDAGKSIHDLHPDKSYIDLNRAGIALMEIVSEPDLRSSQEAMAYVKKLRTILRYLGTCDGNMEQGSLRVDANISLHKPDTPFGTRAEIKNLNSVRFLGQALEYEILRQIEILEDGRKVEQETRLFDSASGKTRSMRSKENAHDYRYFPDPDLKPVILSDERIENIKATLPELPDAKKDRFINDFSLSSYDASILVSEKEIADYYETLISFAVKNAQAPKMLANWLISEVFGAMNKQGITIDQIPFPPKHLATLVSLIIDETISGKIAKDVFAKMWESGDSPESIVEKLGLKQITDNTVIEGIIDNILQANAEKVLEYKNGKQQLFGFFVGSVIKALDGKASPSIVNEILKKKLS